MQTSGQTSSGRFDSELAILRCLNDLRKQGFEFDRLGAEIVKLGPVDLDLLAAVLAKVLTRIEHGQTRFDPKGQLPEAGSRTASDEAGGYLAIAG